MLSKSTPDLQFFELPVKISVDELNKTVKIEKFTYGFNSNKTLKHIVDHIEFRIQFKDEIKKIEQTSAKRKQYDIYNNGAHTLSVIIQGNIVDVVKQEDFDYFSQLSPNDPDAFKSKSYIANEVFLGKTPKWKNNDGSSGTTILLHLNGLNYVIIGGYYVKEFKAKSKIVVFISEAMNSGVYMPYAIDDQQRFYMFDENAILTNVPESKLQELYEYTDKLLTSEHKPEKIY